MDDIDRKLEALIVATQQTNENIKQSGIETRAIIREQGEETRAIIKEQGEETRAIIREQGEISARRMEELGEKIEQLGERLTQFGQETNRSIQETNQSIQQVGERIDQLGDKIDRLALIAQEQHKTVQMLTAGFADQSRAVSSLSQTVTRLVDAAQRSAQASEAAAIVAQNNQNAIRDLIEELRQQR